MVMKKISVLLLSTLIAFSSCDKETQLEEDLDAIQSYLKKNSINAEKKNNIYHQIITLGTGEKCNESDTIAIKYTVKTLETDSVLYSYTQKAITYIMPSTVPNVSDEDATQGITSGLQYGLLEMNEGGVSKLYVPSSYAYGSSKIGDDSYVNLIYEVELCEIKRYDKKH